MESWQPTRHDVWRVLRKPANTADFLDQICKREYLCFFLYFHHLDKTGLFRETIKQASENIVLKIESRNQFYLKSAPKLQEVYKKFICPQHTVKENSQNSDTALQRHCTENSKQIFPEMKLRDLVPNFYIHVLYMCEQFIYSQDRPFLDSRMCKLATRPRSFISGNTQIGSSLQCICYTVPLMPSPFYRRTHCLKKTGLAMGTVLRGRKWRSFFPSSTAPSYRKERKAKLAKKFVSQKT
jgi:hypothetical protein